MVIGCSEAGKNSFARRLRDEADLPLYYLDMIWHKLDKTGVTRQEFNRIQSEILVQDEWILCFKTNVFPHTYESLEKIKIKI